MINEAIYIYIIVSLAVALAYGIATLCVIHSRRKADQRQSLTRHYLREIISSHLGTNSLPTLSEMALSDHPTPSIEATGDQPRAALCEAIYRAMSHTYAIPNQLIAPIAKEHHLEEFLLRRLRRASNAGRVQLLNTLSAIPLKHSTIQHLTRYLYSPCRHIRIAALVAILAASPATAIRTLSELPYELAPYDMSRIITLLRRGLLPIAYEPLLASDNHNLLMLGIAIVASFGIEIADRHLYRIVEEHHTPQLVSEAILALALLGSPLNHPPLRQRIEQMTPIHRRELCHHLSCEGYSTSALRGLFSEGEISLAEPLINSYKRNLVWQQSL